jgi:hydroxyacylglutathione hydrolase
LVLTGDLLFAGDVGRPDLTGKEAARGLAGELYDSLFGKLLALDDSLLVYPGHGAGSLCGRSIGSVRSTTLGYERRSNPALAVTEKERFMDYMTNDLPEQPGNHRATKALNRKGPQPLGEVRPKPLSTRESIPYFQRGAALLDTRPKSAYIEKHVPGSVHLEADNQLPNKVGFVLPPGQPVILLLDSPESFTPVVYSLARVGYDSVLGYLSEGIEGWEASGLPVSSGDTLNVNAQELNDLIASPYGSEPVVVDVREPWEYASGHIPGARLIPLGQLAERLGELDPSQAVALVCASGNRSLSAAALLGQKGFQKVYNLRNGMHGWMNAGLPVSRNGRA